MKKVIVMGLALCMMLSVVGCGKEEQNAEVTTTVPTTASESTAATQDTTTTGTSVTTAVTKSTTLVNTPQTEKTPTTSKWYDTHVTTSTAKVDTYIPPAQAVDIKKIGGTMTSDISKKKYELKFIDDFNGSKLNTNNWSFQEGRANLAETQMNLEENIEVSDGMLKLWGKRSSKTYTLKKNSGESFTTNLTGTTINSKGKQFFLYGRMEARIKMPEGYGLWPAWWTCGEYYAWPWGGEIDIMEFNGGGMRDGIYLSGIHYCSADVDLSDQATAYGSGHKSDGKSYVTPANTAGQKLSDAWHVYGLEWTKDYLYFYLDGDMFNKIRISTPKFKRAFQSEHFMILNMSFGGQAGEPREDTKLPTSLQVDWVKVWQEVK